MKSDEPGNAANYERVYVFGPFRMFPNRQLLLLQNRPVKLSGRAFEILRYLVQRPGELVTKDQLIRFVWPTTVVEESNLKVNVYGLRRSLGDPQGSPRFIATVVGRGYRFVARVKIEAAEALAIEDVATDLAAVALPAATSLIGRHDTSDQLIDALSGNPQVTLVGPGGVGKTTVAVAVGNRILPNYKDGACFIDLSTIEDPLKVPAAIAAALGLRGEPANTLDATIGYLRSRCMFVLLDSCEHVLPMAALFAQRMAASGSKSVLLVTSRVPLGTISELVIRLHTLAFPEEKEGESLTADEVMRSPAVELFTQRALEWADYSITRRDYSDVASICRRLDGLPLALEFAASMLRRYKSPARLNQVLELHLSELGGGVDGVRTRHQTLTETIEWSYQLLPRKEATVFRQVCVFAGAFELEDVVALAAVANLDAVEAAVCLRGLADKSMVVAEASGAGVRYRLLDSTRRYGAQRLRSDPLATPTERVYAQRVLAVFEHSEHEWSRRDIGDWVHHYRQWRADLRKVLAWAFGTAQEYLLGVRLTVAAIPVWYETLAISEARAQIELALVHVSKLDSAAVLKAKLYFALAWSMNYAARMSSETELAWLTAIDLAEEAGLPEYQLRASASVAFHLVQTGFPLQTIEHIERVSRIAALNEQWNSSAEAWQIHALARAYIGHLDESRQSLEPLGSSCPHVDRHSRMAVFQVDRYVGIRTHLAFVTWQVGERDRAETIAYEAVEAARGLRHRMSLSTALGGAAIPIALWNDDTAALDRYVAELRATLETECVTHWLAVRHFYAGALLERRGDPGGLYEMRAAIDELIDGSFLERVGISLGLLAEALLLRERVDEADETIRQALEYQECHHERWCRPELLRIQGRIAQRRGDDGRAVQLFEAALNEARAMGSLSYELRIATAMAERSLNAGRPEEAVSGLGPVYRTFTQGHGTSDLVLAADLLSRASEAVMKAKS